MKLVSVAMKATALVALALVFAHVGVSGTDAQYPPPSGSVEFTGSSTTASVGGDVTLAVTVVDSSGSPVADKACEMYISSQPGTDASVTQDSATTDADGVITGTLHVGTAPGTVQVVANCGDVFAGFSAAVIGVAAAPQAPVEPTQLTLPPTGFAPVARTLPAGAVVALLCGGLLALSAGSALRLVSSRTKTGS